MVSAPLPALNVVSAVSPAAKRAAPAAAAEQPQAKKRQPRNKGNGPETPSKVMVKKKDADTGKAWKLIVFRSCHACQYILYMYHVYFLHFDHWCTL